MIFLRRYQLKRLLHAGEVNTFMGLQLEPLNDVFVHMVADHKQQEKASVLLQDLLAQPDLIPEVIEVGEFGGTWFIVTRPIEPFSGFREWLQQRTRGGQTEPAPVPELVTSVPQEATVATASAASGPGEFTRLFSPEVTAPKVGETPVPPKIETGEFTKLFAASAKPQAAPEAASGAARAAPLPKIDHVETGEFTRFFREAPSPAAASEKTGTPVVDEFEAIFPKRSPEPLGEEPPRAAPAPVGPDWREQMQPLSKKDELPEFFNQPYRSRPIDIERQSALHSDEPERATKPFREASEFTRIFGPKPGAPGARPITPVPKRSQAPASASRLFASPEEAGPVAAAAPPRERTEQPLGEYTRVIGAQTGSTSAAPAAPSVETVAKKPGRALRIALIITGTLCAVALLSVIVFLILKRL